MIDFLEIIMHNALAFLWGHLLAVPVIYVLEGCYKINNPNPLQTQALKVPHLGISAVSQFVFNSLTQTSDYGTFFISE